MAYCVSFSGSDWFHIFVKDVATGEVASDEIQWCKFTSVAWNKQGTGFFYSRYPAPKVLEGEGNDKSAGTELDEMAGNSVYYHKLGTSQDADPKILETEKEWMHSCQTTDDSETLLIFISETCDPVNRLFYYDLSSFDGEDTSTMGPLVKLVDTFDHKYSYITSEGRTFWFETNMDAPRCKIIKMQLPPNGSPLERDPAALAAIPKVDVVPEDSTAVLSDATCIAGKHLVLLYLRDAHEHLFHCSLEGQGKRPIELPSIGSIQGLFAKKEYNELFFNFTNFQDPGTIYRGVLEEKEDGSADVSTAVFKSVDVPGLDANEFETRQVRYKSKDGTAVPMFIIQQKGQRGVAPCLLYGYGGFNISITPSFSVIRLLFIRHFGGRVCIANIRGGGEYGEDWHKAGTIHQKQNVFDDFISAAQYVSTTKLTTPGQLAINGGSNGGLLVGACINQQPELFSAAVAQVGVMDMLRFHKFTIGRAWCSDFGDPDADEQQFKTLYAYSPIHNVLPTSGRYPAVMLTTGDHDDRVVPLHSYKYAAALQDLVGSKPDQDKPLLIRIDTKAGHGAGKPTDKIIEEAADIYSFIAHHTGAHTWQD
ncbi:unnamed protein product [Chrysoparadoxa australica]